LHRIPIVMAIGRPILASIVRAALGVEPGLELFETSPRDVPDMARRIEAHLVILEQDDGDLNAVSHELLRSWPTIRVLLLARDGREAFVWELRPHRVVLGELSIETLRETVHRLAHQEVG
jgi:hypothetical protein